MIGTGWDEAQGYVDVVLWRLPWLPRASRDRLRLGDSKIAAQGSQPLGRDLSSTCLDGIACIMLLVLGRCRCKCRRSRQRWRLGLRKTQSGGQQQFGRPAYTCTHAYMHACARFISRSSSGCPWQIRFEIAQRVGLLFGAVHRQARTRLDQSSSAMQEALWQNHHNAGSQWWQAIACSSGGELVGGR